MIWKNERFDGKNGVVVFELRSCMGQHATHTVSLFPGQSACVACGGVQKLLPDGLIADIDAKIAEETAAMEEREVLLEKMAEDRGHDLEKLKAQFCDKQKEHKHGALLAPNAP